MTKKRTETSTYTPAPSVPEELSERYVVVSAAMSGAITVSEGARRLQMSRNHFQTLMHRAQSAVLEAITPALPGRPRRSEHEVELEARANRLERENARLEHELSILGRMMGAASDLLHRRATARQGRTRSSSSSTSTPTTTAPDPPEEPDGDLRGHALRWANELAENALDLKLAARAVGVSPSTLTRWRARARRAEPLARRRGPAPSKPQPAARAAVEHEVRATRGLVGAAALARTTGTSRRIAAAIKAEVMTLMERERISACERIVITQPGVVRGFDQKWLPTTDGLRPALVCSDASIPYRTHVALADRYDEDAVLAALEEDFSENGPPAVLRLDRARVHRTPRVDALLRRYRVLRLHGPPRRPQYYGQLERQNREHDAWVRAAAPLSPAPLAHDLRRMVATLNERWPRRTLRWRTAGDVWRNRAPLVIDRDALADEVEQRAARIIASCGPLDPAVATRYAIEHALESRGLLRRRGGIEC